MEQQKNLFIQNINITDHAGNPMELKLGEKYVNLRVKYFTLHTNTSTKIIETGTTNCEGKFTWENLPDTKDWIQALHDARNYLISDEKILCTTSRWYEEAKRKNMLNGIHMSLRNRKIKSKKNK